MINSERNTKNNEKLEPFRPVLNSRLDLNLSISEYLNQEYTHKKVTAPKVKSRDSGSRLFTLYFIRYIF